MLVEVKINNAKYKYEIGQEATPEQMVKKTEAIMKGVCHHINVQLFNTNRTFKEFMMKMARGEVQLTTEKEKGFLQKEFV